MAEYTDAKRALDRLHRELMDLNPSAARSLEEGMEETLTGGCKFSCVNGHRKDHTKETRWQSTLSS
jgi:hypothetical protein